MIPRSKAPLLLLTVAIVIAIIAILIPPIPQPAAYHNFADQRSRLGIPNFGDVISNLPFALVGLSGLIFLRKRRPEKFSDPRERQLYLFMFSGLILTAFGSAYYHLAPGNPRLVWDRIPIMMVFMALLAAGIAERVSIRAGLWLFPILEAAGISSVLFWRAGELHGHGDLRFYAAVQVYAILILLLLLLFPAKYTRSSDFAVVVGFYILAKILEESDRQVFALGHVASGHTLKHLAAATAGYWILRMLKQRTTLPGRCSTRAAICPSARPIPESSHTSKQQLGLSSMTKSFGIATLVVISAFLLALVAGRYHLGAVQAICGLILFPGGFITSKIMRVGPLGGGAVFVAAVVLVDIAFYVLVFHLVSVLARRGGVKQ